MANGLEGLEKLSEEQRANLLRFGYELIHRDPTIAKEARRLAAKANPDVYRFPELQAEEAVKSELKTRDEKLAELEQKLIESDARAQLEARRQAAKERGLNSDTIEALIVERSKAGRPIDWDTAMEIVEYQSQSAAATAAADINPVQRNLPSMKDWFADPEGTARREATNAIDELRGRRRRTA